MRANWTVRAVGIAVTVIAALALGRATSAQAPDPLVGTWKLDLAKSSFKPGPAPKSYVVVIDAAGKGVKVSVDAVGADGATMKWGYTSARDGKDAAVTGNPAYDTAAVTQTSPKAGSIIYKKAGTAVVNLTTEVSEDGKTLTAKATGTDTKGQAMTNVLVFAKQ